MLLIVANARQLGGVVARGGRTVVDVLLQYPLYAGIAAMMATGLAEMSNWVADSATPGTLGVLAFLSAGLLNIFVPRAVASSRSRRRSSRPPRTPSASPSPW